MAWKALLANKKESSLIMLLPVAAMIVLFVLILLCLVPVFNGLEGLGLAGLILIPLLALFTVGILTYYLPVWYLALYRGQSVLANPCKVSYQRALAVTLICAIPVILYEAVNMMIQFGHWSLGVKAILVLVFIGLLCWYMWWYYAVAMTMPLLVHDHPEESVWAMTKRSIRMMNGYKTKLFWVDFEIFIWLLAAMLGIYFIGIAYFVIQMTKSALTNPDALGALDGSVSDTLSYMLGMPGMSGLLTAIVALVIVMLFAGLFIVWPMIFFAHAEFYKDLLAEQAAVNSERLTVNGEEDVEVVEVEEVTD